MLSRVKPLIRYTLNEERWMLCGRFLDYYVPGRPGGAMGGFEDPGIAGLGAKLVGAKQALAAIRPGSRVYLGTGCAAPRSLIATLETMDSGRSDLEFVSFLTTSAMPGEAGNMRMVRLASRTPGAASTSRDEDGIHMTVLFADRQAAGAAGGRKPSAAATKRRGRQSPAA